MANNATLSEEAERNMRAQARRGQVLSLLEAMPRESWARAYRGGATMLHYAGVGDNVDAARALLSHGLDVNVRDEFGQTPVFYAAFNAQPRVLELLCAAGADLRLTIDLGEGNTAPLDDALSNLPDTLDCVRVLVANGVRLRTASERHLRAITPDLVAFERGVLRCRAVVVAMLRVKRASAGKLMHWDRYLLREMALRVWCTRTAKEWAE